MSTYNLNDHIIGLLKECVLFRDLLNNFYYNSYLNLIKNHMIYSNKFNNALSVMYKHHNKDETLENILTLTKLFFNQEHNYLTQKRINTNTKIKEIPLDSIITSLFETVFLVYSYCNKCKELQKNFIFENVLDFSKKLDHISVDTYFTTYKNNKKSSGECKKCDDIEIDHNIVVKVYPKYLFIKINKAEFKETLQFDNIDYNIFGFFRQEDSNLIANLRKNNKDYRYDGFKFVDTETLNNKDIVILLYIR